MKSARGTDGHSGRGGSLYHDAPDGSRRAMLAKFGRFAYAAPALALLAEPQSVQAYGGGPKPGHGYGDKNHIHTGPPGLTSGPPGLKKSKK